MWLADVVALVCLVWLAGIILIVGVRWMIEQDKKIERKLQPGSYKLGWGGSDEGR